jgi:polysaccharide deacetylase 2 family uncharacterized protein YibQ
MPRAEASVDVVYLTPQITENSASGFDAGDETAVPARAGGYVAIIMSGAGLASSATERALEDLPREVALAFSPYSAALEDWISDAKSAGHETFVLLPMEPSAYPKDDPGPKALLTQLSDKENIDHLSGILARAKGVTGVVNFMGSRFMLDAEKLGPVLAALSQKGVLFVETPSSATTPASMLAARARLPYLSADLRIDDKATDAAVRQQLLALEKIALERGYAVGVAQPYPVTFNMLNSWVENLESRGVRLVSPSALWKVKQQKDAQAQQEPEKESADEKGQSPG